MVWKKDFGSDSDDDKKNIAYDLRQYYAKIVGEHLIDISFYRKKQMFGLWFRSLESLYTITSFKYNEKEKAKEDYDKLINSIHQLANKFSLCWRGKSKHPERTQEIDVALRQLEQFLYLKMEDSGIFGKGYEYDEDEI